MFRFVGSRNLIFGNEQTSYIRYSPLKTTEENMEVRCVATWETNLVNNFYGGSVESPSITLKLNKIKEVTMSTGDHLQGDNFTFTCVAIANTEPTFSFTTNGNNLDTNM